MCSARRRTRRARTPALPNIPTLERLQVLWNCSKSVDLHMGQFPKFAYDWMWSPTKKSHSRHKNNSIAKRRRMSKMDCHRMDIDPSVFCHISNSIQGNPNFLEIVGNEDGRTVSADLFESSTTPPNEYRANNPDRQEQPLHPTRRSRIVAVMKNSEK